MNYFIKDNLFLIYSIPMFISIIIFIILIEIKTKENGAEYIENLYKKTSLVIKLSFVIGIILIILFALIGNIIKVNFYKFNNDDLTSIFLFILYWLVYVLGVSTNIVSMIYSFKMKSNNSRYDVSINSLRFHILICLLNLFLPITALIAMARMYF